MMKLVLMRKRDSGEVVLAREEGGDGGIAQTSPDRGRAMYLSLVQHLVPSSGLQLHFCLLVKTFEKFYNMKNYVLQSSEEI